MKRTAIAFAALLGVGAVALPLSSAQAYIGEGIQGRPHAGNTPERMYAYRHGIPYTGPRRRHHLYGNPYRTYHYGR